MFLIVSQSCKKEILQSAAKSDISIADAKAWYSSNQSALNKSASSNKTTSSNEQRKNFSLLWNLATENLAKNNKGVVAIPLKNDIKLDFGKYGFRKMLVYKNEEVTANIMEVIFDERDVKERKYAELFEMKKFNGKVILYDLSGNLKTGFTYKKGEIDKVISIDLNHKSNTKTNSSSSQSSTPNKNQTVSCWSEYIDPNDGINWPQGQSCECAGEGYWVRYCTFSFDSIPWVIDFVQDENAPPPGGGTVPYIPSFPGFYGSLPDPCDVDPNSPVTVICNEDISALVAEINELNLLIGLNIVQQEWLLAHPALVPEIKNYFNTHGGATPANAAFIQEALDYLTENPDVPFSEVAEMNNISNSSINLPNLIDTTGLSPYPAFKSIVANLPQFVSENPTVLAALSRYTGFTKNKVMQLLQPGNGPSIQLVSNLVDSYGQSCFGQFIPGTSVLKIKRELVVGLDKVQSPKRYAALGMLMAITTLHEFIHYGRDVNKLTRRININGVFYESGNIFELSISPPYNYNTIQRNNAIIWAQFYEFNIND